MRSAPRKLTNEENLYVAALAALGRRAYSVFEMRKYLELRAETEELAKHVLARLRAGKLLDDARYALDFARTRANFRRQGRFRIARELRQRGVPDNHIDSAVEEVFAQTDEAELVRKLIERRMRLARGPLDQKKMASLYGMLRRAGFDSAVARRELHSAARAGVVLELPDGDSPDQDA